jgi:hypothetical protein
MRAAQSIRLIGWTSWGNLFAPASLQVAAAIRLHLAQVLGFFG